MNKTFLVIVKVIITFMLFSFFGGCLQGIAFGSKGNALTSGITSLLAAIIFIGALYGVWKYQPDNGKTKNKDITLNKD